MTKAFLKYNESQEVVSCSNINQEILHTAVIFYVEFLVLVGSGWLNELGSWIT